MESLQTQLDLLTQSSARNEQRTPMRALPPAVSACCRWKAACNELMTQPAPAVDEQLLASVIEIWTGIPPPRSRRRIRRLKGMEDRLKSHVIGQDEAVDAVCASIRRSRAGISPKRKARIFPVRRPDGVARPSWLSSSRSTCSTRRTHWCGWICRNIWKSTRSPA